MNINICYKCGQEIDDLHFLSCDAPTFLKLCSQCGANNQGVYTCRSCNAALPTLWDKESNTYFIEESESQRIHSSLLEIKRKMPELPSRSTIDTYRSWKQKRDLWHKKLSFAEKLSFYKNMNKSYPESAFDPNQFFEAFDKVWLQDGYFLDYRICEPDAENFGGRPAVFARKSGSMSMCLVRSEEAVEKFKVFDVIEYEKSGSGLFQLVLFYSVYDRFYLHWHSGYDNYRPVLVREHFEELVKENARDFTPETMSLLQSQDIRPRVVSADYVNGHVSMMQFNSHFGFQWVRYEIINGKISETTEEELAQVKRRIFY